MKLKLAVVPYKLSLWLKSVNNLSVLEDPYELLTVLSLNDVFSYYLANMPGSTIPDGNNVTGALSHVLQVSGTDVVFPAVVNSFATPNWAKFLEEHKQSIADFRTAYGRDYNQLVLGESVVSAFYSYNVKNVSDGFIVIFIDEAVKPQPENFLYQLSDEVLAGMYRAIPYPFSDSSDRNAVSDMLETWLRTAQQ